MNTHRTERPNTKRRGLSELIYNFSPFEKLLFLILFVVFLLSTLNIAHAVNKNLLVDIAASGGSFKEGVVGSARFINPLLAQSDADRDLTALIYSGLMKARPDGSLVHDIAAGHTVSEDGLVYSVFIKGNAQFHDGERVTADDILFTINLIQNPTVKSPKRGSWEGVLVERVSDTEVVFTLEQPYAPFVENLTLGILPQHIWGSATAEEISFSEFNTNPIGSGPYSLNTIKRSSSGIPLFYELEAFDEYALGKPFIDVVRVYFFPNEDFLIDAYINNDVDAINSVSTNNLAYADLNTDKMQIERVALPRIFGVFFNQNQASLFAQIEVRKALDVALDKKRIINEVLGGYGTTIESPLPPGILPPKELDEEEQELLKLSQKKRAIDILERNDWEINDESGLWEKKTDEGLERLEFSISTANIPELKAVAEIVREEWEAIGARVDVKVFETGDLNQNVIRPRKYDALLFGEIVGRELDLFAFWHSSQRNDPGLNIALYANITVDSLLEEARTIRNQEERLQKFIEFEEEISNDIPAVFMYAPDFVYVIPQNVQGIELGSVTTPSERFLNIHEWHINTDSVWNFFVN